MPKTGNTDRPRAYTAIKEAFGGYPTAGEVIGITPQAICEIAQGRTKGPTARFALCAAMVVTAEQLERINELRSTLW